MGLPELRHSNNRCDDRIDDYQCDQQKRSDK